MKRLAVLAVLLPACWSGVTRQGVQVDSPFGACGTASSGEECAEDVTFLLAVTAAAYEGETGQVVPPGVWNYLTDIAMMRRPIESFSHASTGDTLVGLFTTEPAYDADHIYVTQEDCLALTSLVHEVIHFLQYRVGGVHDPNHRAAGLWASRDGRNSVEWRGKAAGVNAGMCDRDGVGWRIGE